MTNPGAAFPEPGSSQPTSTGPRSLRELIDQVSGRNIRIEDLGIEPGIYDQLPFPFLALVGQAEMKLALLLNLINPGVGGVLLVGPRGTGKTTAVRSLVDLLPHVPRSLCYYGCMPEDIERGGIDAVCTNCAEKFGRGEPLALMDKVRLIELPLNVSLDDVIGHAVERGERKEYVHIRRGVLAQADRNLLYIDEVNLLPDDIIDAILDASAQGRYTVRRGIITSTYNARFVLIGSMNPEEGNLRSQIMDRFGLRLIVHGVENLEERLEVYRRVQAFRSHPHQTAAQYAPETEIAREEIQAARELLPSVVLPDDVARHGLQLIHRLGIESLRAEITMFEAARAYTAADGRTEVTQNDLLVIAPMALRLRRSEFISQYIRSQQAEEAEIRQAVKELFEDS